jgi:hypothetical protein
MTVNVLDLRGVAPSDLLGTDAKGIGQAAALLRAGRVTAAGDRRRDAVVQPRPLDELRQLDAALRHPLGQCFHLRHTAPSDPPADGDDSIVRRWETVAMQFPKRPHFTTVIALIDGGLR